ncbi:uncharacterized protein LOC133515483 [Cydia pomonella]|uniref:uncharacterized protein LOC133515483 n=1 Tax=Cydia pomonella TaxID=82600 RepID=UPI002ADE1AB2|nr:uncharacterized protein LOC133515483 [Cydia pomonella]
MFFNALFYVEVSTSKMFDQQEDKILRQVTIFAWNLKGALTLAILSASCERFYRNVRVSELVCARAMTLDGSTRAYEEMRRTCKNVVRCNRSVFQRLSVFGACVVDANTPLRLLLIVGSYTVVLLQFSLSSNM